MSDFNYQPAPGARVTREPRVLSARFGDGYEQRVADGINTQPRTWELTFQRAAADIATILAFFEAKGGVTSFTWTPEGESEVRVLCRRWSRGYVAPGAGAVSATFEEVFGE